MTELARRLDQLALANSNGFLNDDEYRILRQNLFEQYSDDAPFPSEVSLVPIGAYLVNDHHFPLHILRPANVPSETPETPKPTPSSSRQKSTIPSGVTNLLGKASGRKTLKQLLPSGTPMSREIRSIGKPTPIGREPHSGTSKLSSFIPKLLQRKPIYRRTLETPRPLTDALNASRKIGASRLQPPPSPQFSSFPTTTSTTTTGSNLSLYLKVPPNHRSTSSASSSTHKESDVFSDDNLSTSKDVLVAISKTEDELHKLVDAFHNLETRTRNQIMKRDARRLPTNPPASVDVLLEGREWRKHRRIPSIPPSAPLLDSTHRHLLVSPTRVSLASDKTSVHSASSSHNLYRTRSMIASASRSNPGPLTTGPPPPLQLSSLHTNGKKSISLSVLRKNSISSTSTSLSSKSTKRHESVYPSSPSPSVTSSGLRRLPSVVSRDKTRLGTRNLEGSSSWTFSDHEPVRSTSTSSNRDDSGYSGSNGNELDNDPTLIDIRRRREELVIRYNARLEFLRAKLKSVELHERLLKK